MHIYINIILIIAITIFLTCYRCITYFCQIIYDMEPDAAKFMRTERVPGALDAHPNIDAIVLNYVIQVEILGAKDNVIHSEKRNHKQVIELPMLNSRTDSHALAKEILYTCDLIHHSRLAEVEQLTYYLKKRKLQGGVAKEGDKLLLEKPESPQDASFGNLPDYIDLLYEDLSSKVKGAHMIQFLARDRENLEALAKNETLISALGRVLREDWKRSISLTTHLVFTFFCFSMHSCFHEIILKCKVGSICMDIIDYELRRYDKWKAELEGGQLPNDLPIVRKPCPSSASMSEIPRSRIPEPVRPKSGNFSDANIKAIMEGSVYDDLTNSSENIDERKLTPDQQAKRFRTLVKKQEHLLRVAYYLLLNIAEDEIVEEKMSKRNIVGLLVKALERENDELLVLVVTFLKKLSIMQCNKDSMAAMNIIEKLPKLLDSNSVDLVHLVLKLMFNLSFDQKLRARIVRAGLLPKVISLLSDDRHQETVLKLLYHLSYDDEVKGFFIDCVSLITDMLLLSATSESDKVMVALGINLAINASNAQEIIKQNRLQSLMTRAFTYQDAMLMKMLHNISEHENVGASFIEFVGDISKAVVESKDEDFVRECVGILSNMRLPDLDWAEIFKHFELVEWVKKAICSNNADPELVLRVVVLLGTAAIDEGCANLLCETNIIALLIDLLKTHQEDDEIVLQIVQVFLVCLSHHSSIEYLVEKTDAPAYLIDLLQDNNKSIKRLCNNCLLIISEHSKSWSERIRIEKFRHHNAQWLQMVDLQQLEQEDEEEDELPPYLNTEYLSTAVVPSIADFNDIQEDELINEKDLDYDYFNSHEADAISRELELEGVI